MRRAIVGYESWPYFPDCISFPRYRKKNSRVDFLFFWTKCSHQCSAKTQLFLSETEFFLVQFRNLIEWNPNQIVFSIFRLIRNTKQTFVWFQINQCMVNTIWFRFDLIGFRKDFSVCSSVILIEMLIIDRLKSNAYINSNTGLKFPYTLVSETWILLEPRTQKDKRCKRCIPYLFLGHLYTCIYIYVYEIYIYICLYISKLSCPIRSVRL